MDQVDKPIKLQKKSETNMLINFGQDGWMVNTGERFIMRSKQSRFLWDKTGNLAQVR